MDLGGMGWGLQTVIGGFLLAAVIAWAALRNRKSTKEEVDRTEQATRDLYRKEDEAHRNDTDFGT